MNADRVRAALDERGITYRAQRHSRAFTAQEVAAAEGRSGWEVAKPVFVWAGGHLSMLVLPAALEVDLEAAADALGVPPLRLATEAEFADCFPDCETGAEPPFGVLYDLQTFVDRSLLEQAEITFALGSHDETATVAVADYLELARPIEVEVGIPTPG